MLRACMQPATICVSHSPGEPGVTALGKERLLHAGRNPALTCMHAIAEPWQHPSRPQRFVCTSASVALGAPPMVCPRPNPLRSTCLPGSQLTFSAQDVCVRGAPCPVPEDRLLLLRVVEQLPVAPCTHTHTHSSDVRQTSDLQYAITPGRQSARAACAACAVPCCGADPKLLPQPGLDTIRYSRPGAEPGQAGA